MKAFAYILIIALFLPPFAMAKGQPAGRIKTLENDVIIFRGSKKLAASIGMDVYSGDIILTSASGTAGMVLHDDSLVSLGPNSKLDMKHFVYEPKAGKLAILIKMLKGTMVYISGAIGKLSPDSVTLETPSSIIGTRGTKVLLAVKGI